jgi:Replication-relaxation
VVTYVPQTADEKILRLFATYPYLTGEQITRLLYSNGSARYVSAKLKALTQQKCLQRLARETINYPYVYCLGMRGTRFLQQQGSDIPLLHPSEHTRHAPLFLRHTLAVNDFLIAASKLPGTAPDITVAEIKHDLTLKRTQKTVVPDGWIDFRIGERTQVCVWLEMDMGTMDQKPFRQKIASIVAFSREDYRQVFGTPSLTVAIASPAGEQRRTNITYWIQKELTDLRMEHASDMFRVLNIPGQDTSPEQLFLSAICSRPFDTTLLPLIER